MLHHCIDTKSDSPKTLFARLFGSIRSAVRTVALAVVAVAATVSGAHADTLLMPKRDFLMGQVEVVWGVTTLANGQPYTLDYGDGTAPATGTVADRSYIAFNKTYNVSGTFTIKLTVGAETTTTEVQVFNAAQLSAADLRGLNINRTIQDGLRWLWTAQDNRAANFPAGLTTSWGSYPRSFTALTVLAFENQGYRLIGNAAPAGLYERFILQRGLNYVVSTLTLTTLTKQTSLGVANVNDPCVGPVEPAPCQGIANPEQPGYGTAVSSLALAGSTALSRTIPAGLGGSSGAYVAGKTLGDILQRLMNTTAWGQNDQPTTALCVGRGGWIYDLSNNLCQQSDGSTVGWDVLALLDAAAAGVVEPAFVKSEFAFALAQGGNNSGSLDYRADNNPAAAGGAGDNTARAGIHLQGLYYTAGAPAPTNARVAAAINYISSRWSGAYAAGDYVSTCSLGQNKGCAYAMYNIFKGLKLQNVASIPAAADWYAEYQDWFVANQSNDGSWTGGTSPTRTAMQFSCCATDNPANSAIALLILSPVTLVPPDPDLFATVGLSPATATNLVGTTHTVTAFAQSSTFTPVAGLTITFRVLTGPNAGKTGTGQTGADGKTPYTYTGNQGPGTDTIRAFIVFAGSQLESNIVTKIWRNPTIACDVDGDGRVTAADLLLIRGKNGQAASGADDPYDPNRDGKIDVADVRFCQLRLTP